MTTGNEQNQRDERLHRNPRAWETAIAAQRRATDAEMEAKLAAEPAPERQPR